MAADATLVQGAGMAVERFSGATQAQGIANLATTLAKGGMLIAEGLVDRGEEFDKAAKEALEGGEFMDPEKYEQLVKELMIQREKYIYGNKTTRTLLEQDLNKRTLSLAGMEEQRTTTAETALLSEYEGGLRKEFKDANTIESNNVLDIVNGDLDYVWNDDAQDYGYELPTNQWTLSTGDFGDISQATWENESEWSINNPGSNDLSYKLGLTFAAYNEALEKDNVEDIDRYKKLIDAKLTKLNDPEWRAKNANRLGKNQFTQQTAWTSRADIDKLIKENSFNKTQHDLIGVTYASVADAASKLKPADNKEFKEKVWSDWTLRNIVQGNVNSAINDPLVGNRSFKQHLFDHLKGKTYTDLGITNEDLATYEGLDPDGEGGLPPINISDGIDENDAEQLTNAISGDEKNPALVGDGGLLQRFFTQHFKDAHNEGIKFVAKTELEFEPEDIDFNPIGDAITNTNTYLSTAKTDEEKKAILDLLWEDSQDGLEGDDKEIVEKSLLEYRKKYPHLTEHWDIELTGGEGRYVDPENPEIDVEAEFEGHSERSGWWGEERDIRWFKYQYWKRFGKHITEAQIRQATNGWTDSWEVIKKKLIEGFRIKKKK
tara:strand:+ start:1277 stop:3085 length:1809 start_codon:yes stop_codon:yes gene_type:complete